MPDIRNMDYYASTSTAYATDYEDKPPSSMRGKIAEKCDSIKKLLLDKNLKYGNSAIEPLRIFSKGSAVEGLFVRCDDKLSRIRTTGLSEAGEDQVVDLIGYLVLISIHMDLEKEKTEQGK